MLSFLRIKVYRRKYIVYLSVLFALCLLMGVLVCTSITGNRVQAGRDDALRVFERTEDGLREYVEEIERYILRVYADPELLADLLLFLSSDAGEYLSARLDTASQAAVLPSFVDSVREFATTGGRRLFRQISVHGRQQANVIDFPDGGSTVSFGVPGTSPLFQEDITRGILYERTLVSPTQLSERVGEIRFLLDSDWVFSAAADVPAAHVAVIDLQGNCKRLGQDDPYEEATYHTIVEQGRNQGELRDRMGTLHYVTYTSGRFGYQFVAVFRTGTIVWQSSSLYLFVISCAALIFVGMALLITANFRQDARFLSRIIETIQQAREGRFTPVDHTFSDNTEYGMIARELDEMGRELDAYIRREYLLRLKQQETEMLALQHQINPHFLYNTLEILRGRASLGGDVQLADAIASLGRLYRTMIKSDSYISMAEEVDLLTAYLDIMELRYEGAFCYQIEMEEGVLALQTVKFWMQPVAENFFLHGFDPDSEFNLMVIHGWEEPDAYVIEILNNGKALDEQALHTLNDALAAGEAGGHKSIGLRNVSARLDTYYAGRVVLRVHNNQEAGVTITVRIQKEGSVSVFPVDRG